jgi:hypothetical protein
MPETLHIKRCCMTSRSCADRLRDDVPVPTTMADSSDPRCVDPLCAAVSRADHRDDCSRIDIGLYPVDSPAEGAVAHHSKESVALAIGARLRRPRHKQRWIRRGTDW